MKLIIAGGRKFNPTGRDILALNWISSNFEITEVVSGCCTGADEIGEDWADSLEIPCVRFPADWKKHGDAAGPIRNKQMAKYADAAYLFPGGKGTSNMAKEAIKAGITLIQHKPFGRSDK